MSQEDRVIALKAKHQGIESRIEVEEARPLPDELELHALKKQKLLIKDEIVVLAGSHP